MQLHNFEILQEEGLSEVYAMHDAADPETENHLKQVLEELTTGCNQYITISKSANSGPGCGKTKLDKERAKLCQREIVSRRFGLFY